MLGVYFANNLFREHGKEFRGVLTLFFWPIPVAGFCFFGVLSLALGFWLRIPTEIIIAVHQISGALSQLISDTLFGVDAGFLSPRPIIFKEKDD
jgi:hypothetical protein